MTSEHDFTESPRAHYGKWAEAGVPHKGWACVGIEDLGAPDHTCEMCERTPVRYVHTMSHPNYPDTLDVGCVCAGNMEDDVEGARLREKQFKQTATRRHNWMQRTWRTSAAGNPYLNVGEFNVVIFERGGLWGGRIQHRTSSGDQMFVGCQYRSEDEIKALLFDIIEKTERARAAKGG